MTTATFNVPAITCEHCVATITRVVPDEVPGVSKVTGDHETKQITVEFEPPATIEAIAASMSDWDFPPQLA